MPTDYVFHHHRRIPSTQDAVRTLLSDDRPVVVSAENQASGRGRGGAIWQNAPRALAVSVGWRSDWPPQRRGCIPLVAGLAALRVIGRLGSQGYLKWPNDIVLRHDDGLAKAGGILVEASDDVVVAGLGLNLWWPDPPPAVGALVTDDPGHAVVPDLARSFARELLEHIALGPDDWGREEYRRVSATLGEKVTWDPDGAGTASDVDEFGRLVVETETGRVALTASEVRHVRMGR